MTTTTQENGKENLTMIPSHLNKDIFFNASVAELRRKAQEHSAALLKNIQTQQQRIADVKNRANEQNENSTDEINHSSTEDENSNNKIVNPSSLDVTKIPNTATTKLDPHTGIQPAIDLPKFPPPSYLSALSNFGLPCLPLLQDMNPPSSVLPPRFATSLANLMDKTGTDAHFKGVSNIPGVNSSLCEKIMTSSAADALLASSSINKIKCPSPTASS